MKGKFNSYMGNFGFRISDFGFISIRNLQSALRNRLLMVVSFTVILISSCNTDPKKPGYEFMPDMYRSTSYETNSVNTLFSYIMTERLPYDITITHAEFVPSPYPY